MIGRDDDRGVVGNARGQSAQFAVDILEFGAPLPTVRSAHVADLVDLTPVQVDESLAVAAQGCERGVHTLRQRLCCHECTTAQGGVGQPGSVEVRGTDTRDGDSGAVGLGEQRGPRLPEERVGPVLPAQLVEQLVCTGDEHRVAQHAVGSRREPRAERAHARGGRRRKPGHEGLARGQQRAQEQRVAGAAAQQRVAESVDEHDHRAAALRHRESPHDVGDAEGRTHRGQHIGQAAAGVGGVGRDQIRGNAHVVGQRAVAACRAEAKVTA